MFRILKKDEVYTLYKERKLTGYHRIYPDGVDEAIDEITLQEINNHFSCGGEFGELLEED